MTISAFGSLKGNGRSRVVLIRLKMTVLAPIPRASESAATMVKPGRLTSMRKPYCKSCQKVVTISYLLDFDTQTIVPKPRFHPGSDCPGFEGKRHTFREQVSAHGTKCPLDSP